MTIHLLLPKDLACGDPPDGYQRWSLRLLADRMVELDYVDSLSYQTVRRTLKKSELKPRLRQQWCIPPKANAEFVCQMEEVLDVYKRPFDPKRPLVCFDERPKQLIAEVRGPIPARPGRPARYDYEYRRNGVANIFMMSEPLAGRRKTEITQQRTKRDLAEYMRQLVDQIHPDADVIVLVMDNLNTQWKPYGQSP